jgi:hypothetical protein
MGPSRKRLREGERGMKADRQRSTRRITVESLTEQAAAVDVERPEVAGAGLALTTDRPTLWPMSSPPVPRPPLNV